MDHYGFDAGGIFRGDALTVMRSLRGQELDAVITDPPYASGGATLLERTQSTAVKYTSTKKRCVMPDFLGDSMDQRSWTRHITEVFHLARELARPGAVLCAFIDWRQLPSMTDAIQWAGWTWRGVVVWDKRNSRPQRGRFRQQTEFVVWGSNGALPVTRRVAVLPGMYSCMPPTQANRYHQTEKPLELMRQLVRICEPGGLILDPFCGSSTTLLAARAEGYRAVGIECSPHFFEVAKRRLTEA